MTTEGQGRAADPVGLGIPVVIDGPWAEPRIYPDMAGMLDNPDAAYAKLKEMGKGLFGPNGALNGLGGLGGNMPAARGNWPAAMPASDPLGGKLGETLGNLIQQGLSRRPQESRAIRPGRRPRPGQRPRQSDPAPQPRRKASR